jgi:uncharacterized Zn-binding protein involved in type VI secretion
MPPAARLLDPTAHGTPLQPGPGSPNVLIGGMPAWRVGADTMVCSLADPKPHGGAPVPVGSSTVLINGMPAARMGDQIPETTPNAIAMGEPTVIIG